MNLKNKEFGTGAGDSYDVYLSQLSSPILWRMLYKGYVGSSYTDWGLECDDDLYYATKTAVHCFGDNTTPTSKYEVPHRVGIGDIVSLEEVQRRGAKVLQVAQTIYDYAYTSTEDYVKASVTVTKKQDLEQEIIDGTKYVVQTYLTTANKKLSSYKVSINSFVAGTRVLDASNNDVSTIKDSTFKIAIPVSEITHNFTGFINITEAKVKSFPIFYANSGNSSTQNYVITDPSETTTARATLDVDAYKATLKIIKSDDNKKPVKGATFNLKYEDGTNIGDYTTDENGTITVSKLRQGNVIVKEIKVPEKYILDETSKTVHLEYNSTSYLEVGNNLKRGNLKVIKIDKDNNEIKIPGVEFQLLDEEQHEIKKYMTDTNGEIYIEGLPIGTYTLKETKENPRYYPLEENIIVNIEWNKTTISEIKNEKLKGQIKVIKVDEDYNEIKLKDVEFQIIDALTEEVVETIKTSSKGEATTSRLPIGEYIVKEVSTDKNYILNEQNRHIIIEKDKTTELEIGNIHKKGNVKVFKVDKDNNKIAIGNVEFDLYSVEFDKIIDTFSTNADGEIFIENLRIGDYKLIEKKTNKWYNLAEDTEIRVEWDTTINTIIENELKKGQIQIIKLDEDNNEIKIKDVMFEVLDAQGNVLEIIKTDEQGVATTQKYSVRDYESITIREIRTNEGYVLDNIPKTIKLEANQVKTVIWPNTLKKGKIRIVKVDSKTKETLEGVTFGIYDMEDNEITQITTNESGIATSEPIPSGKYYAKELSTGSVYYLLNENTFEFEIVESGEIVEKIIENEPTDIIVDVDKEGTVEIKPGETVDYTFSNIANNSNVYLENFKWFDYIPTDYIRLEKMTTGTWNQDLTYSVYYKTNKSDEYILFKEGLKTNENYDLDFTEITFTEDEYIIETVFDFGKVETGFRENIKPTMKCKSFNTLKDSDKFTNHTKTIGIYHNITAEADSKWTTIVHISEEKQPVLPRTGK